MKRQFFFGFLFFLFIQNVNSHPAWGLVILDNGDIIFADILHDFGTIWKYSDGQLSKWEEGQHSHVLYKDDEGYVWGTNHVYIPSTKENDNSLWRKKPGFEKEIIIPPTRNPKEFSGAIFTVDKSGNIYFDYSKQVYKRTPEGGITLFSDHSFQRISSMQLGLDGYLYVVDNRISNGTIYQMDLWDGSICEQFSNVKEENPVNPPFENKGHQILYGMSILKDGTMFIANSSDRRITKIHPNNNRKHVYFSESPWFPVGVALKGQTLYVLEAGFDHENIGPRLLKVDATGKIKELVKM